MKTTGSARFYFFAECQSKKLQKFFSFFRRGPRTRAELLGAVLGCSVFPISLAVFSWLEDRKGTSSGLTLSLFSSSQQQQSGFGPDFQSPTVVKTAPKHQLGGPFRLRESRTGAYITDKELFSDHWTLLYFGFSKCAEVCPTTLRFITDVMKTCDTAMTGDAALEAARLQTVFLSIDSFRDTPEVLEAFVSKFDPRIRALCGNAEEVRQAARAWRVYYSSIDETEEEREIRQAKNIPEIRLDDTFQFDHSSAIYLVGPDGKMKDFFFKEMGLDDTVSRLSVHFADIYGFKDTRQKTSE